MQLILLLFVKKYKKILFIIIIIIISSSSSSSSNNNNNNNNNKSLMVNTYLPYSFHNPRASEQGKVIGIALVLAITLQLHFLFIQSINK